MELYTTSDIPDEEDDIVIRIRDLKVWTPEEQSGWKWKRTKRSALILNAGKSYALLDVKVMVFGFTVGIQHKEILSAVNSQPSLDQDPQNRHCFSGAGKTSLLVSLAGKCTLPSEGAVTVGGANVKDVHSAVEILPQFDVFVDSLTVIEHLIFMTEMKLGSYKKSNNRLKLDILINELMLKNHENTPIFALSGGERRLLSLATSLLSNPEILVCDEPTTGLDSYNATLVVEVLKKLSLSGKTVICCVHQPSFDIFKEFSSVLLMAEGKLLFHGFLSECEKLFESIDLSCPLNYNPAEFYIRAVSNSRNLDTIQRYYKDRLVLCEPSTTEMSFRKVTQRNWFKQVHLLLWRSSLTLRREIRKHLLQLFISVMVSALILGTCYLGVSGTTQRGIQDVRGLLWLITSEVSFSLSYKALFVFEYEMALFKREVGMYKCSAYFVSSFMSFIPQCIIFPVTLVTLATLAVDLPNHFVTSLEIIVALMVSSVGALAYGLGMSALFTSTGVMGDVMPCVDLPLFLMSGAFRRISSMPAWLYPVKYISHFYYAMDAVSNIYWRQIDHIDCPTNSTTLCIKDGPSVLQENGYSDNFIFQDGLGILFVTLLWGFIGYFGLKREERKGYAY